MYFGRSRGSCSDDLGGFMAHQPPKRNNARSLEHNIDIFALAGAGLVQVMLLLAAPDHNP